MAVGIRVAASALADLEAIRAWYAERGASEAGDRVVAEIVEGIEALADHPDLGRIVPEFEQSFLRELIRAPFRIVCRRDPDLVRIVCVWRGERRLGLSALSAPEAPGGLPTDRRAGVVVASMLRPVGPRSKKTIANRRASALRCDFAAVAASRRSRAGKHA